MTPQPQAEVRPADTPPARPTVPLLRLRGRERRAIAPEACLLGPRCLVCRWRREGLIPPADR
ncbi:hypothetical protein [Rubrivirga marina]|uniref:Uncharacterized protein n=1 Tax=Rubrivirga marina TaxID=1196024 RepID=A0A271IV10_9BACT|nr:hypothetical protein [Rubrivirga marina]PAP75091.1 hypothetical protein BSZ37_00810 [Rubrivirga marina]